MGTPHVLAIPYPAQGHVIPLLELSQCLVTHGFKVTFVNSEFNHNRVVNALSDKDLVRSHINLVSITDGLEPWEDRNDLGKLTEAILKVMPRKLEELIEQVNRSDNNKITCIVADGSMGWVLEVAEKMQIIRRAAFWLAAVALFALGINIPELIDDGIIDSDGPLLASNRLGKSAGYFWLEDSTCLQWLDQQPAHSVIYVAFGSFTVFDRNQFQELALGLELTNRPFLWVARPDITEGTDDPYPKGFKDRTAKHGRMVGWAPQQMVLSHPSIACFITHCGWNSTVEGISNGTPFLCWPYFADQFFNQSYICDVWKVGLGFNRDESGIIKQAEIKDKVEQLLCDKTFRARALHLKEKAYMNRPEAQKVHTPGLVHCHIPLTEFASLDSSNFTGVKQESIGSASVNSGFFTTMVEVGDVKVVFTGHDHANDFCGELTGIHHAGYHGFN
ncbi:UDP-Glycosyltransferase superfamily protein [Actinidia rufa]|uniref:UDP-Glycosyltransferase superfamily protein n=1 Tax=Actinidia rufa TaxID=165716 RepID=A0A7J0EL08_9ERIC|nr:UDP-Glycosyltransferase superfamily protein [Actinidia rufa]